MYERRSDPMLSSPLFLRRLGLHVLWAACVVLISLGIGTLGYHELGLQSWEDAFVNAAMLLGGMGQVGEIATHAGKLFAALFALYAGLVLIAVTTLILAPVLHRILHRVHLEETTPADQDEQ
ncbi:MAG TPA: hypothetical protein VGQ69_11765 [Gemmatimonadales bacterium]|jgi:hypothetical protein|nr:hypothetical protein [Gemmatimonadales bacterium]